MPPIPRFLLLTICASFFLILPTMIVLYRADPLSFVSGTNRLPKGVHDLELVDSNGGFGIGAVGGGSHRGGVIMPKLGNATVKAELGRASWKLLHTIAQRYPEHPKEDERETLRSFIYLFSRLYPCGECAAEFQQLLEKYPPQTSSRTSASMYLCSIHNHVNVRLGKEEFDCSKLEGLYDCGCGEEVEQKGDGSNVPDLNAISLEGVGLEVAGAGPGTGHRDPLTDEEMVPG